MWDYVLALKQENSRTSLCTAEKWTPPPHFQSLCLALSEMDRLYIWEWCQFSEWTLSKKAHFIKCHVWQDNKFSWEKKNDACVDWEGYWEKKSWRGCLSKQGNTRSPFDVYEAEWEEHHPAVSSTCLLQHVTPSSHPTWTPTHSPHRQTEG